MSQARSRWRWPVILFLLTFVPVLWLYHGLYAPIHTGETGYRLEIKKGSHSVQLTEQLHRDGVIPNAFLARLWLRVNGADRKLQPGIWVLRSPQSTVSALQTILDGSKGVMSRMRVIEGTRFKDLRALMADQPIVQETNELSDKDLLQAIGSEYDHPEGLFAPDTYHVGPGDTDLKIYKLMHQRQMRMLDEEWLSRADGLPYKTPYEALIMASIVEKETGAAVERPHIAGVFIRRLEKGMRLQTDPTVIYGLGDRYDGNLRRADLRRPTPYNTYTNAGLPPTPIALPSRAAIHAALHPAEGTTLFFVARGDGGHVFSTTLAEHNRAVQRFQMQRRADYRSAPAANDAAPAPKSGVKP